MKKFMKKNEKGFTLAELLIVVAIIAVLVAVSIPIFTTQLEKSREATDAANLRVAYATASVAVLEGEAAVSAGPVKMVQTVKGFGSDIKTTKIGGAVELSTLTDAEKDYEYYVNVTTDGTVTITNVAANTKTVNPITGK